MHAASLHGTPSLMSFRRTAKWGARSGLWEVNHFRTFVLWYSKNRDPRKPFCSLLVMVSFFNRMYDNLKQISLEHQFTNDSNVILCSSYFEKRETRLFVFNFSSNRLPNQKLSSIDYLFLTVLCYHTQFLARVWHPFTANFLKQFLVTRKLFCRHLIQKNLSRSVDFGLPNEKFFKRLIYANCDVILSLVLHTQSCLESDRHVRGSVSRQE